MDIGLAYEKKGETENAINYYLKSTENVSIHSIVKSHRNLGNIYAKINDFEKAGHYFKLAIEKASELYGRNSYDLALSYQYYGDLLFRQGNDSALAYYMKSLNILEQLFTAGNRDIARLCLLIGEYYLSGSRPSESLAMTQRALRMLWPGYDPQSLSPDFKTGAVQPDVLIPAGLNLQAKALMQSYHTEKNPKTLRESYLNLKLSSLVINYIRESIDDEESQMILNNNARETVDLGVEVCYSLYGLTGDSEFIDEAFRFSELGKSLVLLSALRGLQAKSTASIPKELTDRESLVSRELSFYNNLIYNELHNNLPDSAKLSLWNDKVFSLKKAFDSLLSVYRAKYPEYFRLKYDYTVTSPSSVKEHLSEDQVLLAYHLTETNTYGFLIGKNVNRFFEIGNPYRVLILVDSLRNGLAFEGLINADSSDYLLFIRQSSFLYDMLVRPVEQDIGNRRLVIVPDGPLGLLPFDILLKEKPLTDKVKFNDLAYLVRYHAISYSSSATIFLGQAHAKRTGMLGNLLAFAPSYQGIGPLRGGTWIDSALVRLTPITGTQEEVRSVVRVIPGKILLEQMATEARFKALAGNYDILHLAMHTLIDDQKPLYSKLVFHPVPGDSLEDGFLNTYELFNLELRGSLAVLSACNTGTGKIEKSEGIISLARGFFYAGIPSVVMTLWDIEDHSSADLLPLFYQQLKAGTPKDIALQQAKLDYLRQAGKLQSHPYFWAGFIHYGQVDPVNFQKPGIDIKSWLIIFSIPFFLALAYLFINRRVYFNKKRH